jgi:hypothetical protein
MEMKTDEKVFQERFGRMFPGKRLLAVQLNGFSHIVFYDGGSKNHEIERMSVNCAPEQKTETVNCDRAKAFFLGYPHYCYQNNAKEICYVLPRER